jgi:metallo-beta-lactamase family protein
MYILWKLYKENKIPNIPIFVDSPMGNRVLEVFKRFPTWHKLPMEEYNAMCNHINIIQSYKETWETIDNKRSKIIIAGSGMVTGGRVLTYLQQLIDEPSTTVLLVGFQAEGTRGRQLLEGAHEIRFYGKYYPVKATIKTIESLSAHGDQQDLLNWMKNIKNVPEKVYLIHGEPTALDAFRVKIKDTYNWTATIPKIGTEEEIVI